jgi:hypothetical protein
MRYALYVIMIFTLLLTACNGGGDDSNGQTSGDAPQDEQTFDPTFEAQIQEEATDVPLELIPTLTPAGESALVVPLPGTLVASETEDPEPGGIFDSVYLRQEGGQNDIITITEVFSDGRVIRDGVEGLVDQISIMEIDNAINTLNFFGMQGTLMGPPGDDNTYVYRVFVVSGDNERAIMAQDGYMPPEFMALLTLVRQAGDAVPPTATPTDG